MDRTDGISGTRPARDLDSIDHIPGERPSAPRDGTDVDHHIRDLQPADVGALVDSASDAAAAKAIDATVKAYAGPYQVGGQLVSAPVMFKLRRFEKSQTKARELPSLVGASLAAQVQGGQASPGAIARATQQLIKAGKLPAEPRGDIPSQIRTMHWTYGIGIDCACFTRHALEAATKKTKLFEDDDLGLRRLDTNPNFKKVELKDLRPGDVITLDPQRPETTGHNVIVRSSTAVSTYEAGERAKADPELDSFFAGSGPFQEIEVDSSWGAGPDGSLHGGYRRDTWLYDAGSKNWAHRDENTGRWETLHGKPTHFDEFHGAYRASS